MVWMGNVPNRLQCCVFGPSVAAHFGKFWKLQKVGLARGSRVLVMYLLWRIFSLRMVSASPNPLRLWSKVLVSPPPPFFSVWWNSLTKAAVLRPSWSGARQGGDTPQSWGHPSSVFLAQHTQGLVMGLLETWSQCRYIHRGILYCGKKEWSVYTGYNIKAS